MKRLPRGVHWSVLVIAIALVICFAASRLLAGRNLRSNADGRTVAFKNLASLPIERLDEIECDKEANLLKALKAENGLVLKRLPLPSVSHLILRVEPRLPFDYHDFVLFYYPAGGNPELEGTIRSAYDAVRGAASVRNGKLTVVWNLPRPIVRGWFRLPVRADFKFDSLDLTMDLDAESGGVADYWLTFLKWFSPALVTFFILLLIQRLWPAFVLDAILVKKILILGLIPGYVTIVFFLPPFQGPDEHLHWKCALESCRPHPFKEICLHDLDKITIESSLLPHNPENQVSPQMLRSDPGNAQPDHTPESKVTYATPFSHPFVWLVGLWFPRVETVREALFFYYLCRVLPVIVLFAILWITNQKGLMPYSALVFFSFPLVMEQMTVISSDTVPNLGAVVATLVFQAAWRRTNWWLVALLWFLAIAITLAKPPIFAGFFLLPLLATPWRQVPYKRFWFPVAVVLVAAGTWLALQYGLSLTHGGGERPEKMAKMIDFLQTRHGWHHFERLCKNLLIDRLNAREGWYLPLGWLDTGLSDYHRALIGTSFLIALGLDLLTWLGPFIGWLRRNFVLLRTALSPAGEGQEKVAVIDALWSITCDTWVLLMVIILVVVNFLFVGVVDCLINYIIYSEPWESVIYGVQMRYFFPVGILALFLPFCLFATPPDRKPATGRFALLTSLIPIAAASLLPWLWLARQIELTIDLLVRYW